MTKAGFCEVCGEKADTVTVELADASGYGEYCRRCAKENGRPIVADEY